MRLFILSALKTVASALAPSREGGRCENKRRGLKLLMLGLDALREQISNEIYSLLFKFKTNNDVTELLLNCCCRAHFSCRIIAFLSFR